MACAGANHRARRNDRRRVAQRLQESELQGSAVEAGQTPTIRLETTVVGRAWAATQGEAGLSAAAVSVLGSMNKATMHDGLQDGSLCRTAEVIPHTTFGSAGCLSAAREGKCAAAAKF